MAKDDATQPDAEEHEVEQGYKDESNEAQEEFKEEVDSEEEYLSPRQKAIEELVSKRNEDFEQETDVDFSSEEVEEVEEVVKEVAEDLKKYCKVERSYTTGVHIQSIDPVMQKYLNLQAGRRSTASWMVILGLIFHRC